MPLPNGNTELSDVQLVAIMAGILLAFHWTPAANYDVEIRSAVLDARHILGESRRQEAEDV